MSPRRSVGPVLKGEGGSINLGVGSGFGHQSLEAVSEGGGEMHGPAKGVAGGLEVRPESGAGTAVVALAEATLQIRQQGVGGGQGLQVLLGMEADFF